MIAFDLVAAAGLVLTGFILGILTMGWIAASKRRIPPRFEPEIEVVSCSQGCGRPAQTVIGDLPLCGPCRSQLGNVSPLGRRIG